MCDRPDTPTPFCEPEGGASARLPRPMLKRSQRMDVIDLTEDGEGGGAAAKPNKKRKTTVRAQMIFWSPFRIDGTVCMPDVDNLMANARSRKDEPLIIGIKGCEEQCPTTGRIHFHFVICLHREYQLGSSSCTFLQEEFLKHINGAGECVEWGKFEKVAGNQEQVFGYIDKKESKFPGAATWPARGEFKFGGCKQGEGYLDSMMQYIDEGMSWDELVRDHAYAVHRFERIIKHRMELRMKGIHRTKMTRLFWRFGAAGVGKDYTSMRDSEGNPYDAREVLYVAPKKDNQRFALFGFTHEIKHLILGEMRDARQVPYEVLMAYADNTYLQIEVKGLDKGIPFMCEDVTITSPFHPAKIYKDVLSDGDGWDQFMRRVTIFHHKMDENGVRTCEDVTDMDSSIFM